LILILGVASANVTYGYTAANYSGRMPCSEVCAIIFTITSVTHTYTTTIFSIWPA